MIYTSQPSDAIDAVAHQTRKNDYHFLNLALGVGTWHRGELALLASTGPQGGAMIPTGKPIERRWVLLRGVGTGWECGPKRLATVRANCST